LLWNAAKKDTIGVKVEFSDESAGKTSNTQIHYNIERIISDITLVFMMLVNI
jgi:hypothetical protein